MLSQRSLLANLPKLLLHTNFDIFHSFKFPAFLIYGKRSPSQNNQPYLMLYLFKADLWTLLNHLAQIWPLFSTSTWSNLRGTLNSKPYLNVIDFADLKDPDVNIDIQWTLSWWNNVFVVIIWQAERTVTEVGMFAIATRYVASNLTNKA